MNFLSHGLLVRRARSDAVLIGSALPDLAPLADRRLRMTPSRIERLDDAGGTDVARGCRHHREVDRTFHHGQPFHDALRAAEAALPAGELPIPRNVLAHVLVEIGIDAEVLRRYPDFAARTYPDAWDRFDWTDLFAQLRAVCDASTDPLEGLVGRFDSGAFLHTYATDDGVLDRLHGMIARLGRGGLDADQRAGLAPAVADVRAHTAAAFDALMPWELEMT